LSFENKKDERKWTEAVKMIMTIKAQQFSFLCDFSAAFHQVNNKALADIFLLTGLYCFVCAIFQGINKN